MENNIKHNIVNQLYFNKILKKILIKRKLDLDGAGTLDCYMQKKQPVSYIIYI